MKKLSLILVALLMFACLVPALADTAANLPSPVAIQDKQDVIGEWDFSGASAMGIYATAEDIGIAAQIVISDSAITITMDGDTGRATWDLTDDGSILFTDPDGSTGIIVLNDDGTISIETEVEGITLTMYFAKAPQA